MDRLEIIETLKGFPAALEAEIAGLPEAVLRFKPAEDEWSIREVLGHVRLADDIWYKRLYQVWSLSDPVLMTWTGEEEALERARQISNPNTLISELRASRPRIVDLLAHAVDWTRIGQWRGEGRRSLKQLAEYLVSHDADHINQIRNLKAAAAQTAGSRP